MADKQNLSIQEILAACRKSDGDGSGDSGPQRESSDAAEPAAAESPAAPAKQASEMSVSDMLAAARAETGGGAKPAPTASVDEPAAAAAAPANKDRQKMSVQEMLAAARGEKSGGAAASAKPAAKAVVKPKAAAGDKTSPKPSTESKPTGPMDTSSILAAARSTAKPGPMSKAEAAATAKTKPSAPTKVKKTAPPMPGKPAYAKATAKTAPKQDDDRRNFLTVFFGSFLAIGFTTLTMTGGLWTLGMARFFFPNLLIEPPNRFKVGFPGDFSPATVQTKFKAQFGVWIVNSEFDGVQQIVAIKSVCTHLGCTPNWLEAEQKFKCPCHGSGFYKEGINFEGPAPRPLERYAISLADDGQLEVDKSKTFQEQLGQWSDSASFVAV